MAYDPKLGYDPNKDYSLAIVNAGSDEERERLRQERQLGLVTCGIRGNERSRPCPNWARPASK